MTNAFIVTKVQMLDFKQATVDWVYGNDDSVLQGCCVTSLATLPIADRQQNEVVATFLKQELGDAFFAEKDVELENFQTSPPPQ